MAIEPIIPIQKFDDINRVFVEGEIDLRDITAIAETPSTHYGFGRALNCVRVQLGPGKWAYVAATVAAPLRLSWADWKAAHP